MSRTTVPADEQGEPDLSAGGWTAESASQQDATGSRPTRRAAAKSTRAPTRRRPTQRLALPAGPPILNALARTRNTSPSSRSAAHTILASLGFDPTTRTRNADSLVRTAATFGGLCLVLLLASYVALTRHVGQASLTRHSILILALVLAGETVLVTLLTTLASNELGRMLVLGLGGLAALLTTAFLVLGPRAGVAVLVAVLALIALSARQSVHVVAPETVQVTALPGGRHRALLPGMNLVLPSERVQATLSTQPNTFATLPEHVDGPNGLQAEVSLTVHYALIAEQAARAIATTRDWERTLRKRSTQVLREELAAFLAESGSQMPATHDRVLVSAPGGSGSRSDAPAADELRARVQHRLGTEGAALGVEVRQVELGQLLLSAGVWASWRATAAEGIQAAHTGGAPTVNPVDASASEPLQPATVLAPPVALAPAASASASGSLSAGQTSLNSAQAYLDSMQQRLGGLAEGFSDGWRRLMGGHPQSDEAVRPAETPPLAPAPPSPQTPPRGPAGSETDEENDGTPAAATSAPALSARTLEAMYEAIEEGRITDPVTIKHVAEALGQYAPPADGPEGQEALSFDPHELANELRRRAFQPAEPADAEPEAPGDATHPPAAPDATPTAPPSSPRVDDDNVLRGG